MMTMNFRHYILLVFLFLLPGWLPAPDLPVNDAFASLEKMRLEIIKRDKAQYLQKYTTLKQTLAKYESNNNWKEYNQYGFIGKYQFGRSALNATGFGNRSYKRFRANPASFTEQDQEKAMDILLGINESVMEYSIDKYVGLTMLGKIKITRTGILAAAHLAGPANVKEFLDSYGRKNVKDRMGTYISDYLERFAL